MAETALLYRKLTPRRQQLLGFIYTFTEKEGYAPTARELTSLLGLASVSTTHTHLQILKSAGWVTWKPDSPRTLRLTFAGHEALRRVL